LAGAYQRGNEMPARSLRAWAELITSFGPAGGSAAREVSQRDGSWVATGTVTAHDTWPVTPSCSGL